MTVYVAPAERASEAGGQVACAMSAGKLRQRRPALAAGKFRHRGPHPLPRHLRQGGSRLCRLTRPDPPPCGRRERGSGNARRLPRAYNPASRIGGWKAKPVSQGKSIQVSCDTSVMKVSTSGRPIGLA